MSSLDKEGIFFTLFQMLGILVTAFLMIFYPMITRHVSRKHLMRILMIISAAGYLIMLISGLILPTGNLKFILITVGYMAANFGQYFLTKLASALTVAIANITYIVFKIITYTNGIARFEQAANAGDISSEEKALQITELLKGVQSGQSAGLLIVMTVLPLHILMYLSYYLYQRKYKLDEAEYERICAAIRDRNQDEPTA